LFAYGPADATAVPTPPPSSLDSFKSGLVLLFWYRLTQVVLEKRPLNGCGNSSWWPFVEFFCGKVVGATSSEGFLAVILDHFLGNAPPRDFQATAE